MFVTIQFRTFRLLVFYLKTHKLKYTTIIVPVVLYGSET
jgi:hypothetical protein